MATNNTDGATDGRDKKSDTPLEFEPYPGPKLYRPHVIVVGGGVAGMTAAHRLLERGHDVTLLEVNAYLGGKLGAHRTRDEATLNLSPQAESASQEDFSAFGERTCTPCTTPCCKEKRKLDWHEHCYHMYLNWYHNFWQLMRDIGSIDRFEPMTEINYLRADPTAEPIHSTNPGSLATAVQNMTCGVASPADVFLHSQALRDLLSTSDNADRRLDQMSVAAFLQERRYTTEDSRKATHRVLAKAFAAPTAMASAASYKSFLKYGARLPEPAMWLLRDHTENAIFTPWLEKLASLAGEFRIDWPEGIREREVYKTIKARWEAIERSDNDREQMPSFTLMPLTKLSGIELDWDTGDFLLRIEKLDRSPSPQPMRDEAKPTAEPELWSFEGQVVLAVPPRHIASLVHTRADHRRDAFYERSLAGIDPALVNTTRLTGAPIMTLDVVFKRPPTRPLPRGIVLLIDSQYEMSIYDNAQMWDSARGEEDEPVAPHLSICASDAKPLMPFVDKPGGAQLIVYLLLKELQRYMDFDPEEDIYHGRTHLQTNAGAELFINAVDTWHWRPKTTTAIPDLFIAGDFVQTPIDVVTIEGAAMSGLMAAEAVRRRTGRGGPVTITMPDSVPGSAMKVASVLSLPLAYGAKMASEGDRTLRKFYDELFPES